MFGEECFAVFVYVCVSVLFHPCPKGLGVYLLYNKLGCGTNVGLCLAVCNKNIQKQKEF